MGSRRFGNAFIYLIIFVAVIAIFFTLFSSGDSAEETDLTTILSMAKTEQISKIGTITRFIFGLKSFEVSPERGARRQFFERRETIRRLRSAARRGDEANVTTLREILERNRR